MGEYLAWFYDVLQSEAPVNVEITHHRACAVDVQPLAGGGESVLLDDGQWSLSTM